MAMKVLSRVLSGSFVGEHDPQTWEPSRYPNIGHLMPAIELGCSREDGGFEARMDHLVELLQEARIVDTNAGWVLSAPQSRAPRAGL